MAPLDLMLHALVLCCALPRGISGYNPPSVAINTTSGVVMGGSLTTPNGTLVAVYTGIPYAFADRFQAPVPATGVDGVVIYAVDTAMHCGYFNEKTGKPLGSEDCLHLNMYIPHNTSGTVVVVGDMTHPSPTNPPHLLLDQGLAVVFVNYRLNVLGFLSTSSSEAPGNYGLLDLIESLRWLKSNSAAVGANVSRVSLWGHGTGAALVSLLLLTSQVQDLQLVTSAVTMSGSMLCPWSWQKQPLSEAKKLASSLNCPTSPPHKLVDCLKGISLTRLLAAYGKMEKKDKGFPPLFSPVLDAQLIPQPPSRLLLNATRNFTRVPLLVGVVSDEAARLFEELYADRLSTSPFSSAAETSEYLLHRVLSLSGVRGAHHLSEATALARYHYFRGINASDVAAAAPRLVQLMSEVLFVGCTRRWQSSYASLTLQPTFAYVFAHRGRRSTAEGVEYELSHDLHAAPPLLQALERAVSHGDELIYLFDNQTVAAEDSSVAKEMTQLWADFVRHNRPSSAWPVSEGGFTSYARIKRNVSFEVNFGQDTKEFSEYLQEMALMDDDSLPVANYLTAEKKEEEDEDEEEEEEGGGKKKSAYRTATWVLSFVVAGLVVLQLVTVVVLLKYRKKTIFIPR